MRIEQEARTKSTGEDIGKELSKETQDEALEDSFFSEPPKAEPVDTFWDLDTQSDDDDDLARVRGSRRAMFVTFIILGVAVVGIGSYTVYAKVLMPTPVAMGAVASLPEPPQPIDSDSHQNKGLSQNSAPAQRSEQVKPTEQQTPNTVPPPAAVQAPTPPTETVAVASEQETSEIARPTALASQPEPTEGTNAKAAAAGPPSEDTERSKPREDTRTARKDKASAKIPTTRSTSKAASPTVQEASKVVKRNAKRKRAKVRAIPSAKPPTGYKAIVRRANTLYRSRKTRNQAIAEYQRALTLNPNGGEALRRLSYYYLNQGKSSEAEQFAVRAVRANQNNAQSWFLLGAARDARNNRQGALQAYRGCAQGTGAFATQCKALLR